VPNNTQGVLKMMLLIDDVRTKHDRDVLYNFLVHASHWTGEHARRLKEELREHLRGPRRKKPERVAYWYDVRNKHRRITHSGNVMAVGLSHAMRKLSAEIGLDAVEVRLWRGK
jgi:DNA polymerase III delta prime subunit